MRSFFGDVGREVGPAHLKMADLPEGESELLDYRLPSGQLSKWPVVRCRNIYVLPGGCSEGRGRAAEGRIHDRQRQRGLQGATRTGGGGKQGKQRHRREPQVDRTQLAPLWRL